MSVVVARYPSPFGPKRAERDQFETRDFYVADPVPLRSELISQRGRLTCEITDVVFASSIANAKAYLRVAGSAWYACLDSVGTRDGRAEGDSLGSSNVKYHIGAYIDELDNEPEYHPRRR
jgi:hypothetical protein